MIAFALIAVAAAIPRPQSVQQPSQAVPAPANFNPEQGRAGAPEEGKDLQGSASIGYGYYGGGRAETFLPTTRYFRVYKLVRSQVHKIIPAYT